MTTTATAVAHPNIALIKYWGKRDEAVQLPATGSLSLTLGIAPTTTTVSLIDDPSVTADSGTLNGQEMVGKDLSRVQKFLDLVRERAGSTSFAEVTSTNEIPTGAGLASSASGFGALALAAAKAYGLDYTPEKLSALARRGSGSACRSIFGGLVEWLPGDDDASSHAVALPDSGLDLSLVVAVLAPGRKKIDSRAAMRRTVETSPFFPAWVEQVPRDIEDMKAAIAAADFTAVGELAEANAMRMHATMLGALPPVRYWNPDSVAALDLVATLRDEGTECYATMDAGPNVKVLCRSGDAETIADRFRGEFEDIDVLVSGSGPGAYLV
ncbi:diphosphomevalonate decarboxylase [Corynebacterium amycolatum]|uniref:diphosphomevalonate decarboxylase n=1 Tax=Corynebacterium amycolatum TaxID=43765 RepID=A0AAW9SPZ6_CORAY|nr:diphosphomevalonate decarboxylase [Corynebacterium amycolatum]MDK7236883.1 diphosphomevalonate decarboxylase [Corynebacterium amycolatum]MDK7246847.1 diphosphomevalonate decarboxylase [Corynebacterium amycolatum]